MRKLYEQDIIEILYGATLLGAGGGGSLKQGLGMLDGLKKDGNAIEVDCWIWMKSVITSMQPWFAVLVSCCHAGSQQACVWP